MKIIESTKVVYNDIVQCVESDDGEYRVAVYDKPGSQAHEQALKRVREYEESASGAVWGRLIARGAVLRLGCELDSMCRRIFDADDSAFYLFAPKDEDDCREFVTYAKLLGCDVYARPDDYDDSVMPRLSTMSVVAGEKYVIRVIDCSWIYLYPVEGKQDTLAERMAYVQDELLAAFDGEKEVAE